MDILVIYIFLNVALGIVLILKIIHLHYEYKTIKALIESAKTSNQRLDSVEKKLQDKNP